MLIYRSAHSLFNVCTEMGVLIYTPTAQCVCTETGNINLLPPLPTLFTVCTETMVLIKFTHHRPLDAQCGSAWRRGCWFTPHCPLSIQCICTETVVSIDRSACPLTQQLSDQGPLCLGQPVFQHGFEEVLPRHCRKGI